MDTFGLEVEKKILNSGVRNIFTPFRPVDELSLLFGRSKEVNSIITQINTPGQHSILFGDRGVGKSSLANMAARVLSTLTNDTFLKKVCSSNDTFASIVEPLLNKLGYSLNISTVQTKDTQESSAGLRGLLQFNKKNSDEESITYKGINSETLTPSWVATAVKDIDALFLIDEIDVIGNKEKEKIAELIKQLSDYDSKLKFLMVGIADTAISLTAGHKSVQRCLKETHLAKLSDDDVRALVKKGATQLDINFSTQALEKIVSISAGYPHFAHLLSLKACEIVLAEDRHEIGIMDIVKATNSASGDAEGTLRTVYQNAIRSGKSDEYKQILYSASEIFKEEFSAKELRDKYFEIFEKEIDQTWLNPYLANIVSNGDDSILKRLAKGVYKFNDPRMKSYIRLVSVGLFSNNE